MASPSAPKRHPADFFKPYVRSNLPQKRPSPSGDDVANTSRQKKAKSPTPQTPASSSRFRNFDALLLKSPFSAKSNSAKLLPIRSPRPPKSIDRPTYGKGPLFKSRLDLSTPPPISPSPRRSVSPFTPGVPRTAQSVVKDGEVVEVLESDESDSDQDSLLSFEDMFGTRKFGAASSSSTPPELDEAAAEAERVKTLSLFTLGRSDSLVGKDKLRAMRAREHEVKFDISRLMNEHFDDEDVENNIAKAKKGYNAGKRDDELLHQHGELDERLLASVTRGDDDDGEDPTRLLGAMERTETFTADKSFSFFGPDGLSDWQDEEPSEIDLAPEEASQYLWRNAEARSRAFLSGHVAELASHGAVGTSMLKWTLANVVIEKCDELRRVYIRTLQEASLHWTRTNVSANDVQDIFRTLGADNDVLRDGKAVTQRPSSLANKRKSNPKYLLAALELFHVIAVDMDFSALSKLVSLVARLSLDSEIMSDGRISCAVEDTLAALLELPDSEARSHTAERLLTDLGQHLEDHALQARLLDHILPTSPDIARIRVYLANHFLMGNKSQANLKDGGGATVSLSELRQFLQTPKFDITPVSQRSVDWAEVKALAQLFDIAVADGGRPPSFASRAEEVAFNRQIDSLADAVKSIFASIADTGASHMRRTEAKEALNALHYRLLFAIRTEPRPKKNVFGGRDGNEYRAEERSKGFMANFLATQREKKALQEREENRKTPSDSTDSEGSETEVLIRRRLGPK